VDAEEASGQLLLQEFSHYPVSPQLTGAGHDDAEFVKPIP
jgi:hypothetical protein